MPERKYGVNYKTFTVAMTLDEHKRVRVLAAEYGIPAGEVARRALLDEDFWRTFQIERAKAPES